MASSKLAQTTSKPVRNSAGSPAVQAVQVPPSAVRGSTQIDSRLAKSEVAKSIKVTKNNKVTKIARVAKIAKVANKKTPHASLAAPRVALMQQLADDAQAIAKTEPSAVGTRLIPAVSESNALSKLKKSKLVRDSFTIPDHEYKLIHTLKERAIQAGVPLKKSELLRAGILQLMALPEVELLQALKRVDIIKTGRPAKHK